MINPVRTKYMWGGIVLVGIDNHFQLLSYMTDNHCQLEM
ncbi:Uncharacterised protein [Staphylococcus petrasii]|nr:Uncharacterised protein [Staphylococcus petrasii]